MKTKITLGNILLTREQVWWHTCRFKVESETKDMIEDPQNKPKSLYGLLNSYSGPRILIYRN